MQKSLKQICRVGLLVALSILVGVTVFAQSAQDLQNIEDLFGGSYGSNDYVEKKVFSKAVALLLNLEPVETTDCYTDLNPNDETTPYICALKKRRILKGFKSRPFSPDSSVRWDFAIKTLCSAQRWLPMTKYSACKSYALDSGFFDAPLPASPGTAIRGTLDELVLFIGRVGVKPTERVTPQPVTPDPVDAIPPEPNPPSIPTSVALENIDTTFFANITLNSPLPTHFYHNEVYFVEGSVNPGTSADDVFVFLCPDGQSCDDSLNFIGDLDSNNRFSIPVLFEAGNYQMGIIPGRSGSSRIKDISVLPSAPATSSAGTAPGSLNVKYEDGDTTFSWSGTAEVTRLIIFQENVRRDYIFRQGKTSFSPPSEDFDTFVEGPAGWVVKHNNSQSAIKNINLTTKEFSTIKTDEIDVTRLDETFATTGRFTFEAKALDDISRRAAITLPDGQVREINFSDSDIRANRTFSITTNLDTRGTYIFEVNNPEGSAVVNVPIYVGGSIPLVPDYFALNETEPNTAPMGSLTSERKKILDLINIDRRAHGLSNVSFSSTLNDIAQAHSQDMVTGNFFAHVNLNGRSPDDRRKDAGYRAPIRENLGKATTPELVEAGLMRSPIHREAIIDPTMTKVGIGIVKNSAGYYIVTQNFSADPLSASDMVTMENALFSVGNTERGRLGLSYLSHDSVLRSVANSWSNSMVSEDFFSVTDSDGNSLLDVARDAGVSSSIQANIISAGTQDQLEEELLSQDGFLSGSTGKIGIGLGLNDVGELFMTVLYTP